MSCNNRLWNFAREFDEVSFCLSRGLWLLLECVIPWSAWSPRLRRQSFQSACECSWTESQLVRDDSYAQVKSVGYGTPTLFLEPMGRVTWSPKYRVPVARQYGDQYDLEKDWINKMHSSGKLCEKIFFVELTHNCSWGHYDVVTGLQILYKNGWHFTQAGSIMMAYFHGIVSNQITHWISVSRDISPLSFPYAFS